MIQSSVLLDTGPLVAFIDASDAYHEKAKDLFKLAPSPLLTCEAVLSEAVFLLSRKKSHIVNQLLAMGKDEIYEVGITLQGHFDSIQSLLLKYHNVPISLADACLIRCAEIHETPYILTFDSDFTVYRWGKNRKFHIVESTK